jgi:hypothetical protein
MKVCKGIRVFKTGKQLVLHKQLQQGEKKGHLETNAGNHQTSHVLKAGLQTIPPGVSFFCRVKGNTVNRTK